MLPQRPHLSLLACALLVLVPALAGAQDPAPGSTEVPLPVPAAAPVPAAVSTPCLEAPTAAGASNDAAAATGSCAPEITQELVGTEAAAAPDELPDPASGLTPDPAVDSEMQAAAANAQPVVAAQDGTADPRTQAERDFDAIYGGSSPYNPVADPSLPDAAVLPTTYDPWEAYNRRMHRFNNAVDRVIARPLARAYVRVVPRPVRLGVGNFFSNLGQPVAAVNALLQGRPTQAAQSLGRFALNSTLGIGGIFDPATDARLPNRSEDFGQTLGIWGWERSRYVELPLFGPRTLRDTVGLVGDAPLSPLRQVDADRVRIPLQGLQLVDVRSQLLSTDSLRAGAEDDYALVRDAWTQRRNYQIFGDRVDSADDLPDYLRDDSNPQVPADAMPLMPMDVN